MRVETAVPLADQEFFRRLQTALLPSGEALPSEDGSNQDGIHLARSVEFERISLRIHDLIAESHPPVTVEKLVDWERVLGLPDECFPASESILDRQRAVVAKLTSLGGQSPAHYVALAATLGYAVKVREYKPFTCETPCEEPCGAEDQRFLWDIIAPATTINEATCEETCETPLRWWGNDRLECAIRPPAHTFVRFIYELPPDGFVAPATIKAQMDFGDVTWPVVHSEDHGRVGDPVEQTIDLGWI